MPGFFRRRTGHCRRKRFNVYLRKPTESKVLFSAKRDIYVYEVFAYLCQLLLITAAECNCSLVYQFSYRDFSAIVGTEPASCGVLEVKFGIFRPTNECLECDFSIIRFEIPNPAALLVAVVFVNRNGFSIWNWVG